MNLQEIVEVDCPYCGERISLSVDCSVQRQQYIEDCQVCCNPIIVDVEIGAPDPLPRVGVRRDMD
jgi:hypothetical protein